MASLTTTPSRVLRSPTALYPFFAPAVAGAARSCSIVCARARSRRAWPSRDGFLATPIESWKRRLKISSVNSRIRCRISSSDRSRHFTAFIARSSRSRSRRAETSQGVPTPSQGVPTPSQSVPTLSQSVPTLSQSPGAGDELGGDAHLLARGAERLARRVLADAFHLVEDAAGLDHGHPFLGIALALAHAREAPGQGHARRLDLTVRHPPRLERLESVVAKRQGRATLGLAPHSPPLGLAILHALGHQHGSCPTDMGGLATGPPSPPTLGTPRRSRDAPRHSHMLLPIRGRLRQHFALEDPHLHADGAVRGVGRGHPEIDVGADRVERHP